MKRQSLTSEDEFILLNHALIDRFQVTSNNTGKHQAIVKVQIDAKSGHRRRRKPTPKTGVWYEGYMILKRGSCTIASRLSGIGKEGNSRTSDRLKLDFSPLK
ncbi:hypothetical protein AVEN_68959-1 [Araneus ventricosus]|uniref:Uncharacterized protein n=1 Tax=Araneus ventricosus TaxID=182803 RepID=A0A4Y2UQ80_ARAVE|nr:hypothetical protein AVEN_68959-1 [Araneus ventricosus]